MNIDRERFLDDYRKSYEVRRCYVNLYRACYSYEIKTNKKKPFFDQYGYIKSENRYATIDDLEPLYVEKVTSVQFYISEIKSLEKSMLHPNVMDAKYVHVHMAYHGLDCETPDERRNSYYETLFSGYDGKLKSNTEINRWKRVEFPKMYHRKFPNDNGLQFIYNKAEDVLKAYGEDDLMDESKKKKVVFFTGSGISQESGIPTIRDTDGLWEQYPISMVASVNGWKSDPTFVNEFFNNLRETYLNVDTNGEIGIKPNSAHRDIIKLAHSGSIKNVNDENGYDYDVVIITQNVDNLHECALEEYEESIEDVNTDEDVDIVGVELENDETDTSTDYDDNDVDDDCDDTCCKTNNCNCGCCDDDDNYDITFDEDVDKMEKYESKLGVKIIHIHGEIMKMCVDGYNNDEYQIQFPYKNRYTLPPKTTAGEIWKNIPVEYKSKRMRPYVVFFGENVPNMIPAINEVLSCDVFVIIGTSLEVYPAAELLQHVPNGVPIIYIDTNPTPVNKKIKSIKMTAGYGMKELFNNWKNYVK